MRQDNIAGGEIPGSSNATASPGATVARTIRSSDCAAPVVITTSSGPQATPGVCPTHRASAARSAGSPAGSLYGTVADRRWRSATHAARPPTATDRARARRPKRDNPRLIITRQDRGNPRRPWIPLPTTVGRWRRGDRPGLRGQRRLHIGAGAGLANDIPLGKQFIVRGNDHVAGDAERLRERPRRGKSVPGERLPLKIAARSCAINCRCNDSSVARSSAIGRSRTTPCPVTPTSSPPHQAVLLSGSAKWPP